MVVLFVLCLGVEFLSSYHLMCVFNIFFFFWGGGGGGVTGFPVGIKQF